MIDTVEAAKRGDVHAMAALVEGLAPFVGRVCGAIALDDGDDAMQETMIVVLRSLRQLRDPAALHGWVRRIAVRESLRVARRRLPSVDPATVDAAAPDVDIDGAVDVAATLAKLAPEHRAVLVLRHLDGLSEREAADVLGVAAGTVKSRSSRASAAFRKRWSS